MLQILNNNKKSNPVIQYVVQYYGKTNLCLEGEDFNRLLKITFVLDIFEDATVSLKVAETPTSSEVRAYLSKTFS